MNSVIYSRYSSTKQDLSFSIEEQNESCTKKAKSEGNFVKKIFEDKAQSAKTLKRPALASLLQYVCNPKNDIGILYVYDISRLSRNQIDFSILKKELSVHGVMIRSVNGVANDSIEGDLIQDILARVSQYKNEIDGLKVKGGMYNRFKQGVCIITYTVAEVIREI